MQSSRTSLLRGINAVAKANWNVLKSPTWGVYLHLEHFSWARKSGLSAFLALFQSLVLD
jgi:hypothetical protein